MNATRASHAEVDDGGGAHLWSAPETDRRAQVGMARCAVPGAEGSVRRRNERVRGCDSPRSCRPLDAGGAGPAYRPCRGKRHDAPTEKAGRIFPELPDGLARLTFAG